MATNAILNCGLTPFTCSSFSHLGCPRYREILSRCYLYCLEEFSFFEISGKSEARRRNNKGPVYARRKRLNRCIMHGRLALALVQPDSRVIINYVIV